MRIVIALKWHENCYSTCIEISYVNISPTLAHGSAKMQTRNLDIFSWLISCLRIAWLILKHPIVSNKCKYKTAYKPKKPRYMDLFMWKKKVTLSLAGPLNWKTEWYHKYHNNLHSKAKCADPRISEKDYCWQ